MGLGLIMFYSTACNDKQVNKFRVAMIEIPQRINPDDTDVNYAFYVIRQLYEPIFIFNSFNTPISGVLESWESNDNHQTYKFCLKKNIHFSNGKPLTVSILKDNIQYFDNKNFFKKRISSLKINGDCLDISFNEPYALFISDLMSYKMAIVDPDTRASNIVVGISPYYVAEMNDKYIHLSTNYPLKYKNVYIVKWEPNKGDNLWNYDDINLIPGRYLNESETSKYMDEYNINLLKTYVLIINNPDPNIRKYLFNCIDYSGLRKLLYPSRKDFIDIGGVLPEGLPGAIESPVEQKCPDEPLKQRKSVKLLTFFSDSIKDLQNYMSTSLKKTNIDVEVLPIRPNELIDIMRSDEKKYDMTIVGLDAFYSLSMSFFEHFMPGKSMWTTVQNLDLEKNIENYYKAENVDLQTNFLKQANKSLIDNYQVIPLFQENRTFYFSKKVKKVTFFMGIPNIKDL